MAKIKAKSHKGLAKVARVRKSGSIKVQSCNKLHQTTHRSNASRRRRHQTNEMDITNVRRLKSLINK